MDSATIEYASYRNLEGPTNCTGMSKSSSDEEQPAPTRNGDGIVINEEGFATEPMTDTDPTLDRGGICSYVKSGDFLELIAWVVFMAILPSLPRIAARIFWRDIPYQETAAGDVLVELMFDNELVDETVNNQLLVVLGIIVPFVLQMILCLTCGEKWLDVHRSICAFSWAIGISTFVVEFTRSTT